MFDAVDVNKNENTKNRCGVEYLYIIGYKKFALLVIKKNSYRDDLIEYQRYYFDGNIDKYLQHREDKKIFNEYVENQPNFIEDNQILFFKDKIDKNNYLLHYKYDNLIYDAKKYDAYENVKEKILFSSIIADEYNANMRSELYKKIIKKFEFDAKYEINYRIPRFLKETIIKNKLHFSS
jgi:UDP-2,3-diacylglucosamine pyrophosphatase LpxH